MVILKIPIVYPLRRRLLRDQGRLEAEAGAV
jgi:hypothetical protein